MKHNFFCLMPRGNMLSPIPLYHTRSSCVIRGRKWLCHTVYDKTKVFFGASYPVTSTAKPWICIRSQNIVPNNLVGRCRHNHTTITPVHVHQKIPLFYHKTYDTTIFFFRNENKMFSPTGTRSIITLHYITLHYNLFSILRGLFPNK